jgi:hypothetical protein
MPSAVWTPHSFRFLMAFLARSGHLPSMQTTSMMINTIMVDLTNQADDDEDISVTDLTA